MFFFDLFERIIGKFGKEISIYAVYRVNLVGFFLARAGHFALETIENLERLVVNRHQNGSDFQRHNHIDYALRIGYRNVSSADKEEDIRRRAAEKLTEDSRAFVSVRVIPLTRFFVVLVSADSVGISEEIADKYGIGDAVADIDHKVSYSVGKHTFKTEFRKRSVFVKLDTRLYFKNYAYKFCYLNIGYAFKTKVFLDYAFVLTSLYDIVYIISEVVSVSVGIRYFIKDLANVFSYLLAVGSRRDYIAERYFEHVSHDKRKFVYTLFSERNFRDLSEFYVVYETFDIVDRIFVFKKVVNELADLFVSYLFESVIVFEISKTEIFQIIVERSRPRFVFGTVVYRIAEDFVGNREDHIGVACVIS